MIDNISLDYSNAASFLSDGELSAMADIAKNAAEHLDKGDAQGSDFLGWIDLPINYDKEEFKRIKAAAKKIQSDSRALVVIGIGGSYLGARAAIEFLSHPFANIIPKNNFPEIYFAGNNLSARYINGIIDAIGDKDFSVNVISKSGTTTECAIAFRIFKELLEKKYGAAKAASRIYATTDKSKGALRALALQEGYETFVVPDDIGGRFSVLTAVGLLPIAVSGADIDALLSGASHGRELSKRPFEENDALKYASLRNIFLRKGKQVEILANYEPSLHYIAEWWKQLYGESEGKDAKGIFPASVDLTSDLHSMGQYIQDGVRFIMETVLCVDEPASDIEIKEDAKNLDGLNYLSGCALDYVNKSAMKGTIMAHTNGQVPNLVIHIPRMDEYCLGQLFYFFEYACGVSGYILGVNPFNQPGVENYKSNMFTILGKPGYGDN